MAESLEGFQILNNVRLHILEIHLLRPCDLWCAACGEWRKVLKMCHQTKQLSLDCLPKLILCFVTRDVIRPVRSTRKQEVIIITDNVSPVGSRWGSKVVQVNRQHLQAMQRWAAIAECSNYYRVQHLRGPTGHFYLGCESRSHGSARARWLGPWSSRVWPLSQTHCLISVTTEKIILLEPFLSLFTQVCQ